MKEAKEKNFRIYKTSLGNNVIAGKNAEQNEDLVKKYVGKSNFLLHTQKPGSPFCVVVNDAEKRDIKEAAIFCAKKSQDYRDNKSDVVVHIFKGIDVYKKKEMPIGTFGVKKQKVIKVKKEEIEELKI